MATRVTLAIPVYKRLRHLPGALRAVAAQDYPDVELLVSDNGMNGIAVSSIIAEHYPKAFSFRQNPTTVPLITHLNQLLAEATGEYFVLLCDDDEISPTFVSELAALLDANPTAHVALGRPETMDVDGGNIRQFDGIWPEHLSGEGFLRAWTAKRVRLMSTITLMARTATARACGGYADFPRGLFSDNLLLLKLCLAGDVALGRTAVFRWRLDEASTGFSAAPCELASACRRFLSTLSADPDLLAYAAAHPETWRALKPLLREQCVSWYFFRWLGYEEHLSPREWIRAGMEMPFTYTYYRRVVETIVSRGKGGLADRYPAMHRAYRSLRWRA
jgi:glycosyltransferase involved in cell wall biosynthesis